MEFWSYVSGGKGFISNEISSSETSSRRKMSWWAGDSKTPSNFNNCMLEGQASDKQVLGELGYQDLVGKALIEIPIRDVLSSRNDGGKIFSPFAPTLATFSLEDESTSRRSSSIVDSNSRESSLIDLKLGRFVDLRDVQNSTFTGAAPIVYSSESSVPPKRMKLGVNLHAAYCQVHGCNMDLSSSKEYHKRHKVCEIHSKTAIVIVNGIEQRFCQQCSRFHLLSEFDDGKRSCRKRLAGHNERRRKPQVGFHSGRTGRLIQSYNGSCAGFETGRFHGSAQMATSFICPDILPSSLLHPEKSKANDWSRPVKAEERPHFTPVSIPNSIGNLPSKLLFPSTNFEKVFPTCQDNGANNASAFSESNNQLLLDTGALNPGSRPLLWDSSLRDDDFATFDAAQTIQGFSGITESGCALSLLSPQSHNSSSHSSGIPIADPMIVPGSIEHYNMPQFSEKLIGVYQNTTTGGLPNKFPSLGSSAEGSHLCPILISNGGGSGTMNFDVADRLYQRSHFGNDKDNLFCEDGATIDLLQLSSQLQRVECEKQSIQVKQETDAFRCSGIT